jgi:hypothetical protein
MNTCIYMYIIYTYIYIYIYKYIYVNIYIHMYRRIYKHMYICKYKHMYICNYMYVNIYKNIHVYIYMYVCTNQIFDSICSKITTMNIHCSKERFNLISFSSIISFLFPLFSNSFFLYSYYFSSN